MRFYQVKIGHDHKIKWFTSRREAEKWAHRQFAVFKKEHDYEINKDHDYDLPCESPLFANKKRDVEITQVDVATDKQGLLRFCNLWIA